MRRVLIVAATLLVMRPAGAMEGGVLENAVALYQARRYEAARVLFERAASEAAHRVDLEFYLGRIALWFNDDAGALRHLERANATAPNDARVQNAFGDAYGLRAQDAPLVTKPYWASKCRRAYETAIELDPTECRYRWSLMGFCLLAPCVVGGGVDNAKAQAAEIAKLDPMQGHAAMATIFLSTGRASIAFAEFDEVLGRDPDSFIALYHVGRCAAVSGQQLDRGLAALRRCLVLMPAQTREGPTPANVHQRMGDVLAKLGDTAGAAREYATVRELEPDFRPAKMMLRY